MDRNKAGFLFLLTCTRPVPPSTFFPMPNAQRTTTAAGRPQSLWRSLSGLWGLPAAIRPGNVRESRRAGERNQQKGGGGGHKEAALKPPPPSTPNGGCRTGSRGFTRHGGVAGRGRRPSRQRQQRRSKRSGRTAAKNEQKSQGAHGDSPAADGPGRGRRTPKGQIAGAGRGRNFKRPRVASIPTRRQWMWCRNCRRPGGGRTSKTVWRCSSCSRNFKKWSCSSSSSRRMVVTVRSSSSSGKPKRNNCWPSTRPSWPR